MSAPAARAASALSPLANTKTRAVFPVPCGKITVERIARRFFYRRRVPMQLLQMRCM